MFSVRHLHTSKGHRAALYALAPGRSEHHVLSAGGDGWIVEWDAGDPESGQLVASIETRIFSLCSIPELNLIIAGNMDGGVHWIDRAAPDLTRNIQHHRKGVYDIVRSGQWIFTAGGDGILTRWDLTAARAVESIQLSNQALRCIAISESRQELAVGSSDGSIYFLDPDTLELKNILKKAHTNSVFTLAYGPHHLFSGGRDAMLRVWTSNLELRTSNLELQTELPAHWFTINHLAFSPDGAFLATASRDKTIKIWNPATLELLKVVDTLRHGGHVNSVNRLLWLRHGTLVSCSDDRSVMWWEVKSIVTSELEII